MPTTANMTRAELLMSRKPKANNDGSSGTSAHQRCNDNRGGGHRSQRKYREGNAKRSTRVDSKEAWVSEWVARVALMSAPPSPRQAPAARPSSVRGTRWVVMTVALSLSRPLNNAPMISEGGMARLPTERLAMTAKASSTRRSVAATAVGSLAAALELVLKSRG